MPSWKRVIVSGSDAALNSLNVTGPVTASAFKGDGSQLTGISAGSITVADDGTTQGTATYFNFGTNLTATVSAGTASLSATGGTGAAFPYTGSAIISGSLMIHSSGSTVFTVSGSQGELFSVSDAPATSTVGVIIESNNAMILKVSGSSGDVARFYPTQLQITGSTISTQGFTGSFTGSYFGNASNLNGVVIAVGTRTLTVGTSAPGTPSVGDLWIDTN